MVSRQDQDCTLTWVQRHVYGAHSASMSLMEQVYSTSVEQVRPTCVLKLKCNAMYSNALSNQPFIESLSDACSPHHTLRMLYFAECAHL